MKPVDLRSDTVTRPTEAMRRAMAEAEVGDDVWGDDPTVIALEREVAAMLGKEAALYVPSGHMGNQVAIRSQTRPGDEILIHELAHVMVHEAGGTAVLSGVQAREIGGERGLPGPEVLETWLRDPSDVHHARQSLVCVENTVGEQGGLVFPQDRIDGIAAFAHERGMRLHMDGARLWNAAIASGSDPARIVRDVDSVSVCFSKGLGAPVGSAVVGDAELVATARRNRKLFGGGMRQAGIIAAGALHALRHHVQRLADDHRNARRLAEGLAGGQRLILDPDRVETNIVIGSVPEGGPHAGELVREFAQAGVLCADLNAQAVRFVTHLDVDEEAISAAVERLQPLLR
jgi:threonine aldolase